MHKVQVGVVLDRTLFLHLAGRSITLEDISVADPLIQNAGKNFLSGEATILPCSGRYAVLFVCGYNSVYIYVPGCIFQHMLQLLCLGCHMRWLAKPTKVFKLIVMWAVFLNFVLMHDFVA
ncbi:hypothetical protein ACJX0J_031700 [Zea mays]